MSRFDELNFKKIGIEDLEKLYPFFAEQNYLTCDFTLGGVYMWRDFFNYEYCICKKNVLFIRGNDVLTKHKDTFAVPLGGVDFIDDIKRLYDFNDKKKLYLNVVPEGAIDKIKESFDCDIIDLPNWSEYIYDINRLASLEGKNLKHKRNHFNQFIKRYNYRIIDITSEIIFDLIAFSKKRIMGEDIEEILHIEEEKSVIDVLENYFKFNFEGIALLVDDKIVAFTIGEVMGDVLYTHIEKADISYVGSYQAINCFYSRYIKNKYEKVIYSNREDDAGDLGLRKAKLGYDPIKLLKKYQVVIKDIKKG